MASSTWIGKVVKGATRKIRWMNIAAILGQTVFEELKRQRDKMKHAAAGELSKSLQEPIEEIVQCQIEQSAILMEMDELIRTLAEAVQITSARMLIFGIAAGLALLLSLVSVALLLSR